MREVIFWAFVLLALPACSELAEVDPWPDQPDPGQNLVQGSTPRSDVVFCDIEIERRCATDDEIAAGMPLHHAAVALFDGENAFGNIGLDYSETSRANCAGKPEFVLFQGPFPTGLPVCVNCGDVLGPVTEEKPYQTVQQLCEARCHDLTLVDVGGGTLKPQVPPLPETIASCALRARPSTNMPLDGCFADGCDALGTPVPFKDPRRIAELVEWTDFIDTDNGGGAPNDITPTAEPGDDFNASAVTTHRIEKHDAWVEFTVNRNDRGAIIGLSSLPSGCTDPADCPDTEPGPENIQFGLLLDSDGLVYVRLNGAPIPGQTSHGAYSAGTRFRISVAEIPTDSQYAQQAIVSFARIENNTVTPFYTHMDSHAVYPMRVKASFLDAGIVFQDVRMVRLKPTP